MRLSRSMLVLLILLISLVTIPVFAGKNRHYNQYKPQRSLQTASLNMTPEPCDSLLSVNEEFQREAIRFFRKQADIADDIIPAEMRKAEQIGVLGDATIFRQGGMLKMARFDSLKIDSTSTFVFEGTQIVDAWQIGDFYFVRTRLDKSSITLNQSSDRFYILGLKDLRRYNTIRMNAQHLIQRVTLMGRDGEIIYIGQFAYIVVRKNPQEAYNANEVTIADNSVMREIVFPTPIVKVTLLSDLRDSPAARLPLVQFDLEARSASGGVTDKPHRFVDLNLTSRESSKAGYEVATEAKFNWFSWPQGNSLDYFVGVTGEYDGTRNRVLAVIDREYGRRKEQTFYLPPMFNDALDLTFSQAVSGNVIRAVEIRTSTMTQNERSSYILLPGELVRNRAKLTDPGTSRDESTILPIFMKNAVIPFRYKNSKGENILWESDPDDVLSKMGDSLWVPYGKKPLQYFYVRNPLKGNSEQIDVLNMSAMMPLRNLQEIKIPGFASDDGFSADLKIPNEPLLRFFAIPSRGFFLGVPGFMTVKTLGAGKERVLLFFGQIEEHGKKKGYLSLFSTENNEFLLPFEEREQNDNTLPRVDVNTYLNKVSATKDSVKAKPSPLEGTPEDWTFEETTDGDSKILWIKGIAIGGKQARHLRIDIFNGGSSTTLTDPKYLEIQDIETVRQSVHVRLNEAHIVAEPIRDADNGRLVVKTKLTAFFDGMAQSITIDGEAENLRMEKLGETEWKIIGNGHVPLLSQSIPMQFHWLLGTNTPERVNSIVNARPEPIYRDDQIEITVTDSYLDKPPRIYFKTGQLTAPQEIRLVFQVGRENKKKANSFAQFLALIFGLSVEEEVTPLNEDEIESVSRDGELLFIKTKAGPQSASKTYVWSLKNEKLVFSIPNLQAYRDIGKLRFYVGQATTLNDTNIAVFDRTRHEFITYFDFKRLRLAIGDPDFIRPMPESKQIVFKTEGGLTRVFDENINTFIGLLPPNIKDIMADVEKEFGEVLNTSIFMNASDPLYGRDEFINQLAQATSGDSEDISAKSVLVISPPRAGATHLITEFINRWISGLLPESKSAQIVFLKINPGQVGNNTSYRGQYADKFVRLKEAAVRLRDRGYKLVVVLENVNNIDHTPHNFGEGDIFTNLVDLVKDHYLSVLATVSPGGLDRLTRKQAPFMALFNRQLRLNSMTPKQTQEVLSAYLKDHRMTGLISEQRLENLVLQMRRLQARRALPGSAFDFMKALLSERSGSLSEVTDAQIRRVLARSSGVPEILLDVENATKNKKDMLDYLNTRVKDQPELMQKVVDALFSFTRGLNRADIPIFRGLFPGPTGTGKTELMRAIADYLFHSTGPVLKINGADYSRNQDPLGLSRIIAAHIENHPFNIILADEIEKMDEDARNIFLALADGDFADANGNVISSALTIFLATTNIGDQQAKVYVQQNSGRLDEDSLRSGVARIFETAVHDNFQPAIINRFDVIHPYSIIRKASLRSIILDHLNSTADLGVVSVGKRMQALGIHLEYDDSAIDYMAEKYTSVQYGARRLTGNIEVEFVNSFLNRQIDAGKIRSGESYLIKRVGEKYIAEPLRRRNLN